MRDCAIVVIVKLVYFLIDHCSCSKLFCGVSVVAAVQVIWLSIALGIVVVDTMGSLGRKFLKQELVSRLHLETHSVEVRVDSSHPLVIQERIFRRIIALRKVVMGTNGRDLLSVIIVNVPRGTVIVMRGGHD